MGWLSKIFNPVTIATGGANLINEKAAEAVGIKDPVAEYVTGPTGDLISKGQDKINKLVDERTQQVKDIDFNANSFADVKHNIAITNPEANFGFDLAHDTSTHLVDETGERLSKIGGNSIIGKIGDVQTTLAERDERDAKGWATRTLTFAAGSIGGTTGAVVGGAGTVNGLVQTVKGANNPALPINRTSGGGQAGSTSGQSFADYLNALLRSLGGTSGQTGQQLAAPQTVSRQGETNKMLIIGGVAFMVVALILK